MNIYLIAAIFLSFALFALIAINLYREFDYDKLIEKFDLLDDESQEEILSLMKKTAERNKRARERRRIFIAKIISSNRWTFVIGMSILWRLLTEEEKEQYKSHMREKYPHLRNAIDDEEGPPSNT